MASSVTKTYQNLIIGFHVTVKNVGDVFLGHSVHVQDARMCCADEERRLFSRLWLQVSAISK